MYYGKISFNFKTKKLDRENNKPELFKLIGKVTQRYKRKVNNDDNDL